MTGAHWRPSVNKCLLVEGDPLVLVPRILGRKPNSRSSEWRTQLTGLARRVIAPGHAVTQQMDAAVSYIRVLRIGRSGTTLDQYRGRDLGV
ncbi:hypothetical protein EVAR_84381_1 [Eumeta japonica]|uniref:Uncharacterized protein n=1 Tax=Eumeta variegata TaxID=151549 RepID=A0A4C1U5K1_EUMVA|nr:hypothetical protein EVAR_84381_1 [Eumeta japonica]